VKDEVENAEDEVPEQNGGETAGQEGESPLHPSLKPFSSKFLLPDGDSTRHTSPQTDEKPSNKVDKGAPNTIDDRPHVDWSSLSMDQKLESLHTLVEWQFQNPTRLRTIMKSDDESASWVRVVPLTICVPFQTRFHSVPSRLDTTANKTRIG
jgi:hypothetical protein